MPAISDGSTIDSHDRFCLQFFAQRVEDFAPHGVVERNCHADFDVGFCPLRSACNSFENAGDRP